MEPDEGAIAAAEMEAHEALSNYGIKELLEEGHKALLLNLVVKVRAGTASKEDKAQLRQMLKDNGMVYPGMTTPDPHAGPQKPPVELPELGDPDYE